jgi:hypothetical protein
MKRTQIYLSAEQWRELNARSKREHTSVAELIRRAINQVYRAKRKTTFRAALHDVAGIWADRADIGETEEYVRALRKGTRSERFGLKK